ncbi:glycosyltransferase family 2 protein [Alloscardovia macacae]|nr:glycosyltransferase family 2 protein [Alloscardovia macacae]OTA26738.1 hypothetical protein B9G54_03950 [Alloscardovia macacae]OZG54908.1 glycosyl transferase [Alloscardovia macacae]
MPRTPLHIPAMSIVIPSYNVASYVEASLQSAMSQTLKDIEILVVDDGSTDSTASLIRSVTSHDNRVKIISLPENKGRHSARLAGVLHSRGKFIIFLDADDTIEPATCEILSSFIAHHPDADIIRYGTSLELDNSEDADVTQNLEALLNASMGTLHDIQILQSSFNAPHSPWIPWNLITSAFRGGLIREAFRTLEDIRLNKLEDAYEYFAICSHAHTLYSLTEVKGLRYHFGRGISGRSRVEIDRFAEEQQQAYDVDAAVQRYTQNSSHSFLEQAAQHFHERALMIVTDDFVTRLDHASHERGLATLQMTWGLTDTYKGLSEHIFGHIKLEYDSQNYPLSEQYIHWKKLFALSTQHLPEADKQAIPAYRTTLELIHTIEKRAEKRTEELVQERERNEYEERERLRLEYEESLRILKSGTRRRAIFERLFPLDTRRREIVRYLAKIILRR